jgi:hypothetical protein
VIVVEVLLEFLWFVLELTFDFWLWGGSIGTSRTGLLPAPDIGRRSRRRRLAIACLCLLGVVVIALLLLAVFK